METKKIRPDAIWLVVLSSVAAKFVDLVDEKS
jgi:hypothetical protein